MIDASWAVNWYRIDGGLPAAGVPLRRVATINGRLFDSGAGHGQFESTYPHTTRPRRTDRSGYGYVGRLWLRDDRWAHSTEDKRSSSPPSGCSCKPVILLSGDLSRERPLSLSLLGVAAPTWLMSTPSLTSHLLFQRVNALQDSLFTSHCGERGGNLTCHAEPPLIEQSQAFRP
jgi:hypothetical protein